jgi:hypothetical protein
MTALPPKAEVHPQSCQVPHVPISDIDTAARRASSQRCGLGGGTPKERAGLWQRPTATVAIDQMIATVEEAMSRAIDWCGKRRRTCASSKPHRCVPPDVNTPCTSHRGGRCRRASLARPRSASSQSTQTAQRLCTSATMRPTKSSRIRVRGGQAIPCISGIARNACYSSERPSLGVLVLWSCRVKFPCRRNLV